MELSWRLDTLRQWNSLLDWILLLVGTLGSSGYSRDLVLSHAMVAHGAWYSLEIWLLNHDGTLDRFGYSWKMVLSDILDTRFYWHSQHGWLL